VRLQVASTLGFVQTLGVGVGARVGVGDAEPDGVEVGTADPDGLVVEVPGNAQEARIVVAAATARSPGATVRMPVIRTAWPKGLGSADHSSSRSESMKFGVVLPGGIAPQQLEQAILAEESGWDGSSSGRRATASSACARSASA
jgi:hypothetical protein